MDGNAPSLLLYLPRHQLLPGLAVTSMSAFLGNVSSSGRVALYAYIDMTSLGFEGVAAAGVAAAPVGVVVLDGDDIVLG